MKPTLITYNGKTQTISAWAKEYGMTYAALKHRLIRWKDFEKAISEPLQRKAKPKRYEYKGKKYTVNELSIMHGNIGASAMQYRLQTMTGEEAVEMPNRKPHRKVRITEEEQKRKFIQKQDKPDTTQCRTCQYRLKDLSCGYAIVERRCRMFISKRSPNCTVYIKGKSIVQEAVRRQMGKVRI